MQIDYRSYALIIIASLAGGAGGYMLSANNQYAINGIWRSPDGGPSGTFEGLALQIRPIPDASVRDASLADTSVITKDAAPKDAASRDASNMADAAIPDAGLPTDATSLQTGFIDINYPTPPSTYGMPPPGLPRAQSTLSSAPPAPGGSIVDPDFATRIHRLAGSGVVYSQLQTYSRDNKYYITLGNSDYEVRRRNDGSVVIAGIGAVFGGNAPRWRNEAPLSHKLIWIAASPARIVQYDLDTLTSSTIFESTEPFAYAARTHEQIDRLGKYTILYTYNASSQPQAIYVVDLYNRTAKRVPISYFEQVCPGVQMSTLNWAGVSPLGKYFVLSWTGAGISRCRGMEIYDIATGAFLRHAQPNQYHSDLGLDENGNEVNVTVETDGEQYECTDAEPYPFCFHRNPWNNNFQSVIMYRLDGQAPPRYVRLLPYGAFAHISCQGRAGECVLSGGAYFANAGALIGEVGLINLASGNIWRLAHHRSSEVDYWRQAKATISYDGSRITFSSDFGQVESDSNGIYEIQVSQ